MVQKDKQPEWFPEAKVRLDPSRRFSRPRGPCILRAEARRTRINPKTWSERVRRGGTLLRTKIFPRPNLTPLLPHATRFFTIQVFCNGEEVMTVGGTQEEYVVDIWSGNHPFFLGKSTAIMTNAGRVSRFGDRFGDLGALSEVETIDDVKADIEAQESKAE